MFQSDLLPREGDFYFILFYLFHICDINKIAHFELCELSIWVCDHASSQVLAPPTDTMFFCPLANMWKFQENIRFGKTLKLRLILLFPLGSGMRNK